MTLMMHATLALFAAELGLFFVAPHVLGRLAFVPVGKPARVDLSSDELAALRASRDGGSLAVLPAAVLRAGSYTTWLDPARGLIVTRVWRTVWRQRIGVATTRVALEGDAIVARTRLFPFPLTLWVLALLSCLTNPAGALVLAPLLLLVTHAAARRLLHARDVALEEIQALIDERLEA
ncbi:MAG: hypothetical protein HYZ29_27920 [Myxococcales bacterium]|nr:hypothetical protein [Myxococcales bacterium]